MGYLGDRSLHDPSPFGGRQLGRGQLVYGQLGGASNNYITADGMSVTDGTRVRAHIGRLANGDYGLTITGPSGDVLIDGEKIQLSQSEGTIPAGVALGIPQTTVTAAGLKVSTGGNDRVIAGNIGGGVYGLKVVSTDGTTVIIDGTSEHYRILSSGTESNAKVVDNEGFVETTLTGLGTFSATPAHHPHLASSAGNTGRRFGGLRFIGYGSKHFAATTSGGSPTSGIVGLSNQGEFSTYLDGSSQCVASLFHRYYDNAGPDTTIYAKYDILTVEAL